MTDKPSNDTPSEISIKDTLERYIRVHDPQSSIALNAIKLNPPASSVLLNKVQQRLGLDTLPESFTSIYTLHNGADYTLSTDHLLEWLPLEMALHEYEILQDMAAEFEDEGNRCPGVNTNEYGHNPLFLPIFSDHGGHFYCIDFDPNIETGGTMGQIISYNLDNADREIVSPSLLSFFQSFTDAVTDGLLVTHVHKPYAWIASYSIILFIIFAIFLMLYSALFSDTEITLPLNNNDEL